MIASPRIRVLLAEDERHLSSLLQDFLESRGFAVTATHDGASALQAMRMESFDVALIDIVMPELDGLEVLRAAREEPAPPEVIIITGNGTIETAITAMKLGAFDYLAKPYRMAEIEVLVRRAHERRALARENAVLQTRLARVDPLREIVTRHESMRGVLDLIGRVARSDSPVLITGESGTGKELVARAIHSGSERGAGPLVDIDCAAIGSSNVEYDLFGHEAGAFPGATTARTGLLELASGGSLFMDEIAGLEDRLQGVLLRALEHRSFLRVGGRQKIELNARIIAATNRDLPRLVADGTFRADLYYRVNTIAIVLPPLRERIDDIAVLADHFLRQFGGATPPTLTDEAIRVMRRYRWPGNVRELRNVIERAVLLASGPTIGPDDLPLRDVVASMPAAPSASTHSALLDVERAHILGVLQHVSWHQGRAASILGISSKTLYRKIREYGFQRPAP
ncbi:MAG: Regulatory protein AtoC [Gemmatimonadaceae bacterium]|nr:Regulatory protein AtoC [Gemmatimonadaceae bacterium]